MPCRSDVLHMSTIKGRIYESRSKAHDFDCELMIILLTSSDVTVAVSRDDWTGQSPVDRHTLSIFLLKKSINSCAAGHYTSMGVFVRPDPVSIEIDCHSFLG